MRAAPLLALLTAATCHLATSDNAVGSANTAHASTLEERLRTHIRSNQHSILRENNRIGRGCSSQVYALDYDDKKMCIKHYHDLSRCAREIAFLTYMRTLALSMVPAVYMLDREMKMVVMERLYSTLDAFLKTHRNDPLTLERVLCGLFDGLAGLHAAGILHGDLHPDNIMMRGGDIVFVDFAEGMRAEEFSIDLMRLRYWVLSETPDWEKRISRIALANLRAFEVIEKTYANRGVSWLFWLSSRVNPPGQQHVIHRLLQRFTALRPLMKEYNAALHRR